MAQIRRPGGFTIIELMVTLAIAGVLIGFALPAFNGFINQRQITATVNDFVLAMNYARSEAARLGGAVTVQAITAADTDNEWGPGFCVVQGTPGNCDGTTLRRFGDGYPDGAINGLDTLDGIAAFTFNSRGLMTAGAAGAMSVCATDTDTDPGRTLTVTAIGRVSVAERVCHP
ncbi:MAG: GspH/FimT family pseudopilin [Pseudomonadota bacterium]